MSTTLPEFLSTADAAASAALAVDPAPDATLATAAPTAIVATGTSSAAPDTGNVLAAATTKARTWTRSQEGENEATDILIGTTWHGRQASNKGKTCTVVKAPYSDTVRGSKRVEVLHPTGRHSHPAVRSFLSDFARDPADQQPPGVLTAAASPVIEPAPVTVPTEHTTVMRLAAAVATVIASSDALWLESVARTIPSVSALARTISMNLALTPATLAGKIPTADIHLLWPPPPVVAEADKLAAVSKATPTSAALAGIPNALVYRGQIRLGDTAPARVVIDNYATGTGDRYHVKAAPHRGHGDLSTTERIETMTSPLYATPRDDFFESWLTKDEIVARWPNEESTASWAPALHKQNLPSGQFRLGDSLHLARIVIAGFDPTSGLYTLASGTSARMQDVAWRSSPITYAGILDGWPTVDADQTDHFKIEVDQIRLGNDDVFYEGAHFLVQDHRVLAGTGAATDEWLLHHTGPLERTLSDTWVTREKLLYLCPKIGGVNHEAPPASDPVPEAPPPVIAAKSVPPPAQIKDAITACLRQSSTHSDPVAGIVQHVAATTGASAYDVLVWGDNLVTRGEIHLSRPGDITLWVLGPEPVTTEVAEQPSPSDTMLALLTPSEVQKLTSVAEEYSEMLAECGIEATVTPLAVVRRIIRGISGKAFT